MVLIDDAIDRVATAADRSAEALLADSVGEAMGVVLERLSPNERVAFVLHDSFDVDFPTIAEILDSSPGAARKLASRARSKSRPPSPRSDAGGTATSADPCVGHIRGLRLVIMVWSAIRRLRTVPERIDIMKTMTCKDLGGPCDLAHHGETADDVINAQDAHLKEVVKAGDEAHVQARKDMKGRWMRPRKALGWYNDVKERFAALPEG